MDQKSAFNPPPPKTLSDGNLGVQQPAWAEAFPGGHFLEVIQKGVERPNIPLTSGVFSFILGRSPQSHGILDNIMVSKTHLMLVYGKNTEKEEKLWVEDLGSQNKSFLNKKLLTPFVYYPLYPGDVIQIADEFILILCSSCKKDLDVDGVEYETPSKLRLFTQKPAVIPQLSTFPPAYKADSCIIDPVDTVKRYFEQKVLEPEYEETAPRAPDYQWTVRLGVTLYDEYGDELFAQGVGDSKGAALYECAIEACKLIQLHDNLDSQLETVQQRKQRELVENDFYDDEDDSFYDRSGQIEKKREDRMKRFSTVPKNVENFKTLNAKLDLVRKEIQALSEKIEEQKPKDTLSDDDDLDKYMNELQCELDQKVVNRYTMELSDLKQEEQELMSAVSFLAPLKLPCEKGAISPLKPSSPPLPKTKKGQKSNDQPFDLTKVSSKQKASSDQSRKAEKKIQPPEKKKPSISQYCAVEEDFDWLPPEQQSGDGSTHLNEKFNY